MKTEILFEARGLELRHSPQSRRPASSASPPSAPAFQAQGLELASGECLALLGPNGSGKTTLLKALNGLILPAAGSLRFKGEDAASSRELRRRSVYLHQSPYLLAGTVAYNARFGAYCRGMTRARADSVAREALRLLGLEGFERRSGRALSGGEAQRVALARAFASGADILLLDEPTASADAVSAALILEALKLRVEAGTTVIFSTHDHGLAKRLASRILILEAGQAREMERK